MADETVIVDIQYDVDEALSSLQMLSSEIENEKRQQKLLKDELKKGEIGLSQYASMVEQSKQKQQSANRERKATVKLLASEQGSIEALRAKVSQLTMSRNKTTTSTKEGRLEIQRYNKQINELNKTIDKNLDKQGKQKTNIGNYKSALSGMPPVLGNVVSGIENMTRATLAFLATPIGAVIGVIGAVIGTLVSYFKSSEEGQNAWNKVTQVASAVFGVFADALSTVGKFIAENITDANKLKETWQGIKDWFDNVFTFEEQFEVVASQFGRFSSWMSVQYQKFKGIFTENDEAIQQALREQEEANIRAEKATIAYMEAAEVSTQTLVETYNSVSDAIGRSIDRMKEQADQAQILADRQARLDVLERENIVTKERNAQKIADLILLSRQETATYTERMDAIKEAQSIKEEELKMDEFIAKERLAIKKIENSFSNSTKEDLRKEAELEAELFRVQKTNADQRRELINRENELNNRIKAERIKEEKRRIDAIAKLTEIEEERLVREAETLEERKRLQIKFADDELARELEKDGILHEEKELLYAEHKQRLLEIDQEYQADVDELEAIKREKFIEALDEVSELTSQGQETRVGIIAGSVAQIMELNDQEKMSSLDKISGILQASQGLTNLIVSNHMREQQDLERQKAHELKLAGDNAEKREKIEEEFAKKEAKLKAKQAKEDKAKAIIDATIATAVAVTKAIASGLPLPGIPLIALATATGAAQIATIQSQPIPEFEEGGAIIGGKPHSQGGTKFYGEDGTAFEAERGEAMFVMKKDATAELSALSAINESHGGRSFFNRGSSHLADGGKVGAQNIDRAVDDALRKTPIYVRVGDIETGLTDFGNVKQVGVI